MTLTPRERTGLAIIVALVVVIRLVTLGSYPLMDPTESRYGEIARKMLETGNWIMPQYDYGVPFWGKPPLSTWLSAASMAAFGVNEFAVRLPSLLLLIGHNRNDGLNLRPCAGPGQLKITRGRRQPPSVQAA